MMKTKICTLAALTLLFILAACSQQPEGPTDFNVNPGARADENGTIYISHVEPADLTLLKQPANFTIAFPFPMDQDSVEAALQISPEVEYSYRWSGTDLLITFIRGADNLQAYTVSFTSPIKSLEGDEFPPTSWTVNFQLPSSTPTRTPLPTRTPRPPTATPTVLSFSTIPPLFPTATLSHALWQTTTPIPTPDSSSSGFRLADLSIEEYVALIQELDQYAFANDIMSAGEKRYHYPYFQYPMKFAVLEALRTHPQTAYTQELEWKLALINATAELPESDDWIIQALEDALNQGLLQPWEINVYLNQFGFKVRPWWTDEDFIVPNLFGDGVTQSVFVINSDSEHNHIGGADDGILATLRGTQPGEYDLVKLFSRYNFAAGRWNSLHCPSYIMLIPDGNPVVCVAFVLGYSGHFPTDLYLLEWQGDHFINLAENLPQTGYDYNEYGFFPEEYPGVDILIEKYMWKNFLHGYSFNGEDFVMVYADPPSDLIYELVTTGQFDKAVSNIETLSLENAADEILESGPYASGSQLFEFASSLVYAFNNQSAEAKQAIQDLIHSIDAQEYPLMLQAVQQFNQVYYDAADIYAACQAALDILYPAYQETWGESDTYRDPAIEMCLSDAPILAAINLINPGTTTELPTILRNSGIDVVQSQPIDALNDGARDWVIAIRTTDSNDLTTIITIQHNGKWYPKKLQTSYNSNPNLSASLTSLPGLSYPAVVILDGEEITIVEIDIVNEKVTFNTLLNQYAASFGLTLVDQVFLTIFDDGYFLNFQDYRWNQNTTSFEKADLVNNLLFYQEITPETINILQQIYREVSDFYLPSPGENESWSIYIDPRAKLLYAIGLAYELNGNLNEARKTYYDLWYYFPDTPYAIMARAKLEPVSP